jgi:DNA mismatch repair protein MutL
MSSGTGLPRIRQLPPELANLIAAGEVVERPASVVKELVENSIDAGAAEISVALLRGGVELIRVTDDGHGIAAGDLALALERHATSKLSSADDLAAIASLGFRGEALPSIAAVGRLSLTSAVAGAPHAWRLDCDPRSGRNAPTPAAHPRGTTVEIRDLFAAVPARRRFLRAEQTEYLHVLDTARRLALSRPGLSLKLRHNRRLVLDVPAGSAAGARHEAVFGAAFSRQSTAIDLHGGRLHLHGRLGLPGAARAETDRQYLYLNHRPIRDRLLMHAVRTAYGDSIAPGRHPVYLLYVELDPADVDVNVHPAKNEVRFRHARDVHDFVHAAVREAMAGSGAAGERVATADGSFRELAGSPFAHRVGEPPAPDADEPVLGRPLAALAGRWILATRGEALVLIDAAAARALWARHRIARDFAAGALPARPILVPLEIAVGDEQAAAIGMHAGLLERAGLELRGSGPQRVMVRAIPVALDGVDLAILVEDVGRALCHAASGKEADAIRDVLSALAGTLPAGPLDMTEMTRILRALEQADVDAAACSRRGVWRTLEAGELQDLLGRGD